MESTPFRFINKITNETITYTITSSEIEAIMNKLVSETPGVFSKHYRGAYTIDSNGKWYGTKKTIAKRLVQEGCPEHSIYNYSTPTATRCMRQLGFTVGKDNSKKARIEGRLE